MFEGLRDALQSLRDAVLLPSPRDVQPWEKQYFRHLTAEWRALNVARTHPDYARIEDLIAVFERLPKGNGLHRNDLLEFEQTLLRHRSLVSLVQIAPMLRQRFHDVVGDRVFSSYQPTKTLDCAKAGPAERMALYDDLATLVSAIHWRYILFPFSSQLRTVLTMQALVCMLLYTVVCGVVVWCAASGKTPAFVAVVITCIYSGVVGGFISALRRMQTIGDDGDPIFVVQGIRSARFWLLFSPMLGGVFASIALLFFLSGLVSGSAFPAFHTPGDGGPLTTCATDAARSCWWFWGNLMPASQSDFAKLFLWCFIAGFAERFVPDMLDSLVARANPGKTPTNPAAPMTVTPGRDNNNNGDPGVNGGPGAGEGAGTDPGVAATVVDGADGAGAGAGTVVGDPAAVVDAAPVVIAGGGDGAGIVVPVVGDTVDVPKPADPAATDVDGKVAGQQDDKGKP